MAKSAITLKIAGKEYRDPKIGMRRVSDRLRKMPDRAGPLVAADLKEHLDSAVAELAAKHSRPWPQGTTGSTLSKRTGKSMSDLRKSVVVTGRRLGEIEGEITLDAKLALHEAGGVLKARKTSFLAIPLPAALKSDGTPAKKSPRSWPDTFIGTSRRGNLLIFQKRGRSIVPLYALKRRVRIPARLGLHRQLADTMPKATSKILDSVLAAVKEGL